MNHILNHINSAQIFKINFSQLCIFCSYRYTRDWPCGSPTWKIHEHKQNMKTATHSRYLFSNLLTSTPRSSTLHSSRCEITIVLNASHYFMRLVLYSHTQKQIVTYFHPNCSLIKLMTDSTGFKMNKMGR